MRERRERRERRYLTRGFARAIGWGALLLILPTFAAAMLLLRGDGGVPAELQLAGVAVLAAVVGGSYATTRLPAHPDMAEAMRNGAIVGLGVVGVGYLVSLLLAFSARNGWDQWSPVGFVEFGSFFLGWLLPMGIAGAVAGATTGHVRSRRVRSA